MEPEEENLGTFDNTFDFTFDVQPEPPAPTPSTGSLRHLTRILLTGQRNEKYEPYRQIPKEYK